MRTAFFETLAEQSEADKNTYLLTGDLGFKLFDSFREACRDRFIDMGIAESNMVGVAAGLSLCGKNVYCYSIIPFLIMRAFEQIRVDIAFHNLNVKFVGVGGGVSYGLEGFTHFALEDISLMRSLPNMTVVVPADPSEAQCLALLSRQYTGPLYIRLGKNGDPAIHRQTPEYVIGKAMVLIEGKDVALFAVGSMVGVARQVGEFLISEGIMPTVINMHTIKPIDAEAVKRIASGHPAIFTLEEHYVEGGLGSAVAEILAEEGYGGVFRRFGVPTKLTEEQGTGEHLRRIYGLTAEAVRDEILKELEGKKKWIGKFALLTR